MQDSTNQTNTTYRGHTIDIVFSGAPDWFDFYIDGKPWGCARANKIVRRVSKRSLI